MVPSGLPGATISTKAPSWTTGLLCARGGELAPIKPEKKQASRIKRKAAGLPHPEVLHCEKTLALRTG